MFFYKNIIYNDNIVGEVNVEIVKTIIFLIVGFVLLIKASDIFVDAVSSIATHFKMSKMMIALTVAAFGTCAPELAISFNSISSGNGDIALANVIGSDIINIILIIGLAALVTPIKVKNSVIKKELPILLIVTSIFSLALITHYLDGSNFILTRGDGLLFVSFFMVFIVYIVSVVKNKEGLFERSNVKYNMVWSIILIVACCAVIIFASDVVVKQAQILATMAKLSTKVITMTVVVIGTSLPEMTMTVISARKQEFDIAIGNIIGTNIFNIGIVLGLPLLIYGGFTTTTFNLVDIFVVQLAAVILYFFSKNDRKLSRKEGIVMLLIFIAYYAYVILQ